MSSGMFRETGRKLIERHRNKYKLFYDDTREGKTEEVPYKGPAQLFHCLSVKM